MRSQSRYLKNDLDAKERIETLRVTSFSPERASKPMTRGGDSPVNRLKKIRLANNSVNYNTSPGPGEQTIGQYCMLGKIGEGGFGTIFKVRSLSK